MPAKKKTTSKATPASEPAPKLSLMKAAFAVLESSDEAMGAKDIVAAARERGLWEPGAGKTPEQTLYSAIAREIKTKGEAARFNLVGRGRFTLASKG